MVVGIYEQIKVSAQLFVVIIMVAFDGGFLDCPVHALDLAVRPRMVGFGQAVLDFVGSADHVEAAEARDHGVPVSRLFSELDAPRHCLSDQWRSNGSIGQDDVNLVGNRLQDGLKKDHGSGSVGLFIEPDDGKF